VSVGEEIDAWHGTEAERRQARATYRKWLGHHPTETWDAVPFIARRAWRPRLRRQDF